MKRAIETGWRAWWGYLARQEGVATLDWIGLTAVVLVFLTAILLLFQTSGCTTIGHAVRDSFNIQIQLWDGVPG